MLKWAYDSTLIPPTKRVYFWIGLCVQGIFTKSCETTLMKI